MFGIVIYVQNELIGGKAKKYMLVQNRYFSRSCFKFIPFEHNKSQNLDS